MERGLADWLKERCRREGLSLRQAGLKTKLSHGTIADVMQGKRVNLETIAKLAEAFSGGNSQGQALHDELLTLAGYRKAGEEITQPVARLVDRLSNFTESQLKIMGRFADFLAESEGK